VPGRKVAGKKMGGGGGCALSERGGVSKREKKKKTGAEKGPMEEFLEYLNSGVKKNPGKTRG